MAQQKSFYEIHITVRSGRIYALQLYCNEKGYAKDYAVGEFLYLDECEAKYAFSAAKFGYTGSCEQLMLTHTIKDTFENVLTHANSIVSQLEDRDIVVERVKIETPAQSPVVQVFKETLKDSTTVGYFEFHFKVSIMNQKEDKVMKEISRNHRASFSYNAFGKTKEKVLATLRVKTQEYKDALKKRNQYMDDLEKGKLYVDRFGSGCHYEYTVYDTNPYLDDGFVPRII